MQNSEEKKNRPQDKWDEKAGLVPKTYKVDKEVGVAMGTQLTRMMKEFIEEVKK